MLLLLVYKQEYGDGALARSFLKNQKQLDGKKGAQSLSAHDTLLPQNSLQAPINSAFRHCLQAKRFGVPSGLILPN